MLETVRQAALDRRGDGQYDACVGCEEPIPAARLRALPDVQTCVRCQDRLERFGHQVAREAMELEFDEV